MPKRSVKPAEILDHAARTMGSCWSTEQGHFDLTMITTAAAAAPAAQVQGHPPVGRAATGTPAVENLKRKVQGEVQPFFDELPEPGHDDRNQPRPPPAGTGRTSWLQHKAAPTDLTERLKKFDK